MANYVRGPFIEYECSSCGTTCQENAPRNPDRLVTRIAEINAAPRRVCAGCWNPTTSPDTPATGDKEMQCSGF